MGSSHADAGIPEYWVLDLNKEQLIRYFGSQLKEVEVIQRPGIITSSILPKEITMESLLGS
jgi:Uma2 family endonuclease